MAFNDMVLFRRFAVGIGAFGLLIWAGCSSATDFQSAPALAGSPAADRRECNAAAARAVIGTKMSDEVLLQSRQLSGAETTRVAGPDAMLTQDFVPTRLTIRTDEDGRIASMTCG